MVKTIATRTANIGPKMNFNKNANICATINNKMMKIKAIWKKIHQH